ncbi:MAG: SDR family NAD(P)-dependent oxidoreductase [Pseudomonadota bacterium]|nr:SDR family NAD(P)-dependent oxidoreductase [Pseudomonadota bacterium]
MLSSLADRVVVVTGATSGIGRAAALRFAAAGAKVVGTGRDQRRLADLAPHVDCALTLDVTDPEGVAMFAAAVVDRYGGVDVLVNNAGIGLFRGWETTDDDALRRVMDVNLFGPVALARALLPSLIARKGVLLQVASVAGKRGYAKHTAYCASKHALIGWSESLRHDLRGTGCDVVVVCPPAVRTPFFENAGYMTFDEDHPNLVPMTADAVADGIVAAAVERPRSVILSPRARALYALSVVAPGLLETIQRFKK